MKFSTKCKIFIEKFITNLHFEHNSYEISYEMGRLQMKFPMTFKLLYHCPFDKRISRSCRADFLLVPHGKGTKKKKKKSTAPLFLHMSSELLHILPTHEPRIITLSLIIMHDYVRKKSQGIAKQNSCIAIIL